LKEEGVKGQGKAGIWEGEEVEKEGRRRENVVTYVQ
jgi:hypothetical protein